MAEVHLEMWPGYAKNTTSYLGPPVLKLACGLTQYGALGEDALKWCRQFVIEVDCEKHKKGGADP